MAKTAAKVQTESKHVIAVNETEIKAQLGQIKTGLKRVFEARQVGSGDWI